ncbi:MAG: SAM-dependent methyltransferase [Thermodesulfovibrionales bacterium]
MGSPLEQKIIRRIKAEGRITFEQFMEMALYDPEFGYYRSPDLVIGKGGDFYTSAHLHPVFGGMVGKQIMEMWEFTGRPDLFAIIEVGGGEGHICLDMLLYLQGSPFFDALRYIIVEINPAMQQRQKALLSSLPGNKVQWVASLQEIGPVGCGCVFSNELLDAFPVHLVEMGKELREIYIAVRGETLVEEPGPLSSKVVAEHFDGMKVCLDRGYRTEANIRIRDWLVDVSRILNEGFVLTIDYGYLGRDYYSEDRNRGTLICYHQHQANEDPLCNIGMQDITCHVNFSAVKIWGEEVGLRTVGLSSQGAFLVSLGIDEEIQKLSVTSEDYLFELARIKKLIMPQGMGDSHMVMLQYKGPGEPALRGFSLRNQMKYL